MKGNLRIARWCLLALLLAFASASAQQPPAPPPPPPPPSSFGLELKPDVPVSVRTRVMPVYPVDEACLGIGGIVLVGVDIDSDGQPLNVSIARSSRNRSLDKAALSAARQFRFEPAKRAGIAISSRGLLPVDFTPPTPRPNYCPAAHFVLLGSDPKTSKYEFAVDDPIHVIIDHENTKPATVTAQWWRNWAPLEGDPSGSGHASTTLESEVSPLDFKIDPPAGGWKPAEYGIEIRVDGVLIASPKFRITAPTPTDPAPRPVPAPAAR